MTANLPKPSLQASPSSIKEHGYNMCTIKLGKDPIPPFLVGTKEYRYWMQGWNTKLDELKEKERNTNDTVR